MNLQSSLMWRKIREKLEHLYSLFHVVEYLIKKFLPDHLRDDSPSTPEVLSFGKSILGIGHIDRHFRETAFLHPHLVDEFGPILHAVHREADLFDSFEPHHTVPVVCVRHPDTTHEIGEYLPSKKGKPAEEGYVGISLDDKAGTEHEIERGIPFKLRDEDRHILDMMLSICIESHDVLDAKLPSITTNVLEPGLKGRAAPAIEGVVHDVERRKLR